MKKYTKFNDQDHEVKTFRWPYWLLPLLFLSLLLVLGLFIFITIHSTDRFGCFFHCEQKIDNGGIRAPDFDHLRNDNNKSDVETITKHAREDEKATEDTATALPQQSVGQIKIFGHIIFPKDRVPDSIPSNSHLKVEFKDVSLQDMSSIKIASTQVDMTLYKKGTALSYEIKCKRPSERSSYDLSSVLNMGWKPNSQDWLKKGDYFTDTVIPVHITNSSIYNIDVSLVYY